MAAESYFANFIAARQDVDWDFSEHLKKGKYDQVRSGLLVDDVEAFGDCIETVRETLGGEQPTLLAGGPPCQGFSLAGRRKASDPRNELVWKFLDAAELLNPLIVLMENVDAIQRPFVRDQKRSVLADLEDALGRTALNHGGYAITRLTLRADHYGVPQRRKRVFLVGVRKDIAGSLSMADHDIWNSEQNQPGSRSPLVAPSVSNIQSPTALEAIWDLVEAQYAPLELAPSAVAREYVSELRNGRESHQQISERAS